MIHAKGIAKAFGSFTALEDFSYTAQPGCIHGIVGYNGAGKTTVLKLIAGIYRPDRGLISIEGAPVYENERLKRSIFMVQDDPYFHPQGTLDDMALFLSGYYPSWSSPVYRRLAEVFRLDRGARISSFSKGMQRQAALILGLSVMPRYLLMDEAFDGLDLSRRNMMKSLLHAYLDKHEATVLISSHNLRELEGLCRHVAILKDKRIAYAASVEEMHRKRVRYRVICSREGAAGTLLAEGAEEVKEDGKSLAFIWKRDEETLERLLASYEPLYLQTEPLALEEIFLEEMEAEEYDFSGIF